MILSLMRFGLVLLCLMVLLLLFPAVGIYVSLRLILEGSFDLLGH